MRLKSGLGILAVLSFLVMPWASPGAIAAPLDLTLFHVNDTHSHMEAISSSLEVKGVKTYLNMGGAALMAAKLKEVRAEKGPVLFLHAGDAVQGTLYFTKYKGEVEMKVLDELSCEAMVVGNHEFDKGPEGTEHIVSLAKFPVLGANLDVSAFKELSDKIKPYLIKEIGGDKVGIIGLITPETKDISSPGDKIGFMDVAETAAKYIAELEAAGVNKIILLTHQGYEEDMALAAKVKGIDLIVGGHSHTLLGDKEALGAVGLSPKGDYPTVVKGPSGEPVYIVQSWAWARIAGVLDVSFDDAGLVTKAQGRPVLLVEGPFLQKNKEGKKVALEGDALKELEATLTANPAVNLVAPDADLLALLKPYKDGVDQLQKEIIAKVAQDLLHVREPGGHESGQVLKHGSQVAPWVVGSMLAKAKASGIKPDLALQNGGGVRTDLMSGDLTLGQVHSLLPFDNTLVLLELSGKEVLEAVSSAVARGGGAFPYLAGARVVLDPSKPKPEQVVKVELAGPDGAWLPLDQAKTYRLITNSFVAGGGDGYETFKKAAGKKYDTGFIDSLVFADYVQGKELKRPESTGIMFVGEE